MSTVLIARFKNKKEATSAARAMKKMGSEVGVMKESQWEDVELARLIDEGMKERGEVAIDSILKKLRK